MLKFLDIFFTVFHTFLIFFNLFGWCFKKTRKINFITVNLTVFSWFVLGIWYGLGYCPLTDWHYLVKHSLGASDLPSSYIKYLFDTLTGLSGNVDMINTATFLGLIWCLIGSYITNFLDWKKRPKGNP
ncbi:MAG: DUF2784 domain-containing protein [Epsilonproteobacteria bacterium]|nr:MAG: DUF2784 domain-containing protein [Campylobacterota bacterium]RLA67769.1 MAG: DUF2784 domain-containing protein [Campylobacterota bacterium]